MTFSTVALFVYAFIVAVPLLFYIRRHKRKEARAREAAKRNADSAGPQAQHPHIDTGNCIGCGVCAEACPVSAITMVMASPSVSADLPYLTPEYETSVPNLFIVGELGGLALIKNAINQGRECVDIIAQRCRALGAGGSVGEAYDVLIVGAGPGGISA